MNLIRIYNQNNTTIDIIEQIPGTSIDATALIWAKGQGMQSFPPHYNYSRAIPVTTAASMVMKLVSIPRLKRLEDEAIGVGPVTDCSL